jgi:predicted GNAT family N-acyltransferase
MELRYNVFMLDSDTYSVEIHDFSKNSHIELMCNDDELLELQRLLELNGYQCGDIED